MIFPFREPSSAFAGNTLRGRNVNESDGAHLQNPPSPLIWMRTNEKTRLREVPIGAHPIDRFLPLLGEEQIRDAYKLGRDVSKRLDGRTLWNVNSTASGGGVAEILQSVLPYVRALGIDARWLVINGTPEFFHITKRIHHALHGSAGDGSDLGKRERAVYERVLKANAEELLRLVRPRDFVFLHDPQTAGIAPHLVKAGAIVVCRCHVGVDKPDGE